MGTTQCVTLLFYKLLRNDERNVINKNKKFLLKLFPFSGFSARLQPEGQEFVGFIDWISHTNLTAVTSK